MIARVDAKRINWQFSPLRKVLAKIKKNVALPAPGIILILTRYYRDNRSGRGREH
jgi:hypothetical protein